jgi:hypothetical protein
MRKWLFHWIDRLQLEDPGNLIYELERLAEYGSANDVEAIAKLIKETK